MSASTLDLSTAPYVGPRSFTAQETLYGREREGQELRALLISERIVLLYSPSGAGKSSLLNAKVIPELERREFAVQPVLRVSLGTPATEGNRYLNSLVLSLQPRAPGGADTPAALPPHTSLQEFLDARQSASSPGGEVLIFDQFEEILTLDPTDIAAKEQFFREVGAALRRRNRWALFSMREEYVPALDPYLRHLPTRLSCTFRLDLLGVEAAGEAISRPAREQRGVEVAPEVVRGIVRNLSLVQVQHADGSSSQEPGPYVEPVQLQVVCLRMWGEWLRRRAPDSTTIGPGDVDAVDNVGDALRDYYEQRVREVAEAPEPDGSAPRGREREIREWFDRHLITPGGIRGQVLKGHERTEGLANEAIRKLVDGYLVRSERRGGRTWYELAHDRLIAPVQESNAAWRRENLVPAQVQAALWEEQGRPEGLLLRSAELRAAEAWAARDNMVVTEIEEAFLARCRVVAAAEERDRARARLIRNLGVGAIVLGIAAVIAAVVALNLRTAALLARDEAQARLLAAESRRALADNAQRALLLAVAASSIPGRQPIPEATGSLYAALAAVGGAPLPGQMGEVQFLALSGDGRYLAAAGLSDPAVYVWDRTRPADQPRRLGGHPDGILALSFSPDHVRLATAGNDQTLRVWRLDRPGEPAVVLRSASETASFRAVGFSPDGALLAAAEGSVVRIWRSGDLAAPPVALEGHAETINALAFDADGSRLATGGSDNTVRVWELADTSSSRSLSGADRSLNRLVFSPDGRYLAAAGGSPEARLWDLDAPDAEPALLAGGREQVNDLAFAPDGRLALASDNGSVSVWPSGAAGDPVGLPTSGPVVRALAFSPSGDTLVGAGDSALTQVWGPGSPQDLVGHTGTINAVAFGPDGEAFYTAGQDGRVREWRLDQLGPIPTLRSATADIVGLAFDGAGAQVAVASNGGVDRWSTGGGRYTAEQLREAEANTFRAAVSGDGTLVALARESQIQLLDLRGAPPQTIDGGGPLAQIALSGKGRRLAAAREDGSVAVWSLPVLGDPTVLPATGDRSTSSLALGDDGLRVAVAYTDQIVELVDLDTGASQRLAGHGGIINAMAFSHDGALLATASDDQIARIWAVRGGDGPAAILRGHSQPVVAVAFSGDDATLATTSSDGTIRVWRVAAPDEQPIIFEGHDNGGAALAFSAGSTQLATGGYEGAVRLWPRGQAELIARACAAAGRNFTLDEWEQGFRPAPYRKSCPSLPVSPSLIEAAAAAARLGQPERATELARRVEQLGAAGEIPAGAWSDLCRQMALAGRATEARPWCDHAVANGPDDGRAYESRAVARALGGDRVGAAADLRRYVEWAGGAGEPDGRIALREEWLASLESGGDPLDAEALDLLRAGE